MEANQDPLYSLRHSLAHVLAQAVLQIRPNAKLAFGPPIDTGCYYDFDLDHKFTTEDLTRIEAEMRSIKAAERARLEQDRDLLRRLQTELEAGHAIRSIPLAETAAITFVAPLIVTLLAVTVLKEQVDRGQWIAIVCSASSEFSGGRIPGRRRASIVLPVPGGPSMSTPRGPLAPSRRNRAGLRRKSMTSASSALTPS